MKAVTRRAYGTPEILAISEIDMPKIKDDEVLVRVRAVTVNRTDCGILTGKPYIIRAFVGPIRPAMVPGTDFAGEVRAVGRKVSRYKVGDRVFGFYDEGFKSQAQYMAISVKKAIVHIPDGVSFQEAVASTEGFHYANNFINKIASSKKKVLVNGATGAIGSAALQILKHMGCYVTAVGNTKNLELLGNLGADKVIDYEKEDFTRDTEQYDIILDAVGKSSFKKCKPLLGPSGIYLSSELGPYAQNTYLPLLTLFQGKRVVFPLPTNCKRSILYAQDLLSKGLFKPVIDRVYPMEEIREAYKYVLTGQKTGNVVIAIP
ncbi:MAG: NAD(P)-dependent alcohol dehydrogenase [Flavobacteriaceae bacterium]